MTIVGWIVIGFWVLAGMVTSENGSFFLEVIAMLILTSIAGFIWNWFIPVAFSLNVAHASFFTLLWVTIAICIVLNIIRMINK